MVKALLMTSFILVMALGKDKFEDNSETLIDPLNSIEETPVVEYVNHDPWEMADWYAGLIIGFY